MVLLLVIKIEQDLLTVSVLFVCEIRSGQVSGHRCLKDVLLLSINKLEQIKLVTYCLQ